MFNDIRGRRHVNQSGAYKITGMANKAWVFGTRIDLTLTSCLSRTTGVAIDVADIDGTQRYNVSSYFSLEIRYHVRYVYVHTGILVHDNNPALPLGATMPALPLQGIKSRPSSPHIHIWTASASHKLTLNR
jgi:hypothetical protein